MRTLSIAVPLLALAVAMTPPAVAGPGQDKRPSSRQPAGKAGKPGKPAGKENRPGRARPPGPRAGKPGLAAKRAQIAQRIRALRAKRLTEALSLDPATAGKLMPILERFDGRMASLSRDRVRLRRALRKQLAAGANDAATSALVDQMVASQRAAWKLQEERFAAVRVVLTPAQAARALIVLPQIDRRIGRQIRRALQQQRKQRRRGPPGQIKEPF